MSKEYNLYCNKHGRIYISVERPPTTPKNVLCPWCAQRLMQPDKDIQKRWQPNYIAEGVQP